MTLGTGWGCARLQAQAGSSKTRGEKRSTSLGVEFLVTRLISCS